MNVEIIRPRPPGQKTGISARLASVSKVLRREDVRKQTRWLTVLLVLLIGGGIAWQFVSAPEPAPEPVAETTSTPAPVDESIDHQTDLGKVAWRDDLVALANRVRVQTIIQEHGKLRLVVATRASDGLWLPREVGLDETIPGTGLTVIRIDARLAVAENEDDVRVRLFHPSDWPLLKDTYGFRGQPIPQFLIDLSDTEMWTKHTGTRRLLGVHLVTGHGGEIQPDVMKSFVPELERFIVAFHKRPDRSSALPSRAINEWLQARNISMIRAATADLDLEVMPSDDNAAATASFE